MSASPPKEPDVEQNAQSGEEQDHMDREQEGTQGTGLDFEVKEQDRWLPIANGWYSFSPMFTSPCHQVQAATPAGMASPPLICSTLALQAMHLLRAPAFLPSVRIRVCDAAAAL